MTAGDLDVVRARNGECLYRRCEGAGHRHHLVCRRCGAAGTLQSVLVERWAHDAAARHGFSEVDHTLDHTLELTGICDGRPSRSSPVKGSSICSTRSAPGSRL